MTLQSFHLIHLLQFIFGVIMINHAFAAPDTPLKLGYVPSTFPRDMIEVNQFAEHAILGQILEPLVDADRFGNMTPGIAESWAVSKDSKTLTFKVRTDRVFSNGKPITSKDIAYSLKRHLGSKSQSNNFLSAISKIEPTSAKDLVITLKEPNVAILKALTRDHLGVVPEGWTFDSKSDEPYVGSGPYRLKRETGKWFLVLNEKSPLKDKVSVKRWEIIFFSSVGSGVPGTPLPDYVPLASQIVRDDAEKEFKNKGLPIAIKEQLSFVQTSLWWYPHGANYRSSDIKAAAMAFLRELVEVRCQQSGCQRATGIVPTGIAGYLPEPIRIDPPKPSTKKIKLRIGGMGVLFDFLFNDKAAKEIADKHNLEFEYFTFSPSDLPGMKEKKPDVIMGSWAGGFNDPEGFLPLLNQLLGVDFVTYLEDLRGLYQKARIEQNWTRRAELFREFNERLVREQRMIPGWKIPMYSLTRPNLKEEEIGFRYTPRLINVKRVQ